jgi:prepilin-type N-terminal cleavage/methylation domain-containing protein
MRKSARNFGFTLFELLIVVGIITLLSAFALPGLGNYLKKQNLSQSLDQLKSDLRNAQNKALTGNRSAETNVAFWAVQANSGDDFVTFRTYSSNGSFTGDRGESESLVGNTNIRTGDIILFEMFTGNAYNLNVNDSCNANGSDCRIQIESDGTCSEIRVNTAGAIFKEENVSCD